MSSNVAFGTVTDQEVQLSQILQNYYILMICEERPVYLEVKRTGLWRRALAFYKQTMGRPDGLKQRLTIDFIGEEGVDAGA